MDSKKELFHEIDRRLMGDDRPSLYLNELMKNDLFLQEYPFTLISDLVNVHQSPQHHPEGSVWNHTMLVVDNAARRKETSENPRVLMWSTLLHDLGKAPTTKVRKGRITSYDHDKWSEKLAVKFLKEFMDDQDFIRKVAKMVRWHMQILFVVKELPFAEIEKMLADVTISEIALLSLCDRMGRGGMTKKKETEEQENVRIFTMKCEAFAARACKT